MCVRSCWIPNLFALWLAVVVPVGVILCINLVMYSVAICKFIQYTRIRANRQRERVQAAKQHRVTFMRQKLLKRAQQSRRESRQSSATPVERTDSDKLQTRKLSHGTISYRIQKFFNSMKREDGDGTDIYMSQHRLSRNSSDTSHPDSAKTTVFTNGPKARFARSYYYLEGSKAKQIPNNYADPNDLLFANQYKTKDGIVNGAFDNKENFSYGRKRVYQAQKEKEDGKGVQKEDFKVW